MKKNIVAAMLALIFLSCAGMQARTAHAGQNIWTDYAAAKIGGSGTAEDPYTVTGAAELALIAKNVLAGNNYSGKTVLLAKDIDLSARFWQPIGDLKRGFSGTFLGNGCIVRGMKAVGGNRTGLFGTLKGARIFDLGVVEAQCNGNNAVGILSGFALNSEIVRCYAEGTVAGISAVGGFVGSTMGQCIITECYANAYTAGQSHLGGFTGEAYGQITSCYSSGVVSTYGGMGESIGAGAFCSVNYGTLIDCISSCFVGDGGFLYAESGGTRLNCAMLPDNDGFEADSYTVRSGLPELKVFAGGNLKAKQFSELSAFTFAIDDYSNIELPQMSGGYPLEWYELSESGDFILTEEDGVVSARKSGTVILIAGSGFGGEKAFGFEAVAKTEGAELKPSDRIPVFPVSLILLFLFLLLAAPAVILAFNKRTAGKG